MKKLSMIPVFGILFIVQMLNAQPVVDHRRMVDLPTAMLLDRGSYSIQMRMFSKGGLLGNVDIGITERFMIGISFGGEDVIGNGSVRWNPEPGILARVQLLQEDIGNMPNVTIGFESQGFGPYFSEFERYETKSRGLFVVAGKNYALLYNLGLHAGVNWSLEKGDKDKEINLFLGAVLSLNPEFHLFLEYDFANNDNEVHEQFGSGAGYLNTGVQWVFDDRLYLQFNVKNISRNGRVNNGVRREVRIGYFEYF